MFRIVTRLEKLLSRNPLLTNCITYGSLSGLAEFSQQTVKHKISPSQSSEVKTDKSDKKTKNYDVKTICHYIILGGVVFAPVLHVWYKWIDKVYPGTTARIVAKKVGIDMCAFAIPYYTVFYLCLNLMSKVPLEESLLELKKKLLPTIATTTAFWVPAQTINFRFVPPRYRVIYLAVCTFIEFNILAFFKKLEFE